jgi:hypothetical protein
MHLQNPESKANRHKPAAQKLCGGFLTGLMAATLFVTARGVAPAASFGLPVALATNNLGGYKVSSALDTNSNAIALWSGQYSYRPGATGQWSAAQSFGGTGSPTQTVHMTATGNGTAVWVANTTGIYTADLPNGGTWSAPTLLATGTTVHAPLFVMNSRGDAGVVFYTLGTAGEIVAYRRAAGASVWGPQEVVTTAPGGSYVTLSGATMGEAGDFAVAWQTHERSCSRFCVDVNFILHVSREQLAGTTWQDSGPLNAGVNNPGYSAFPVVDARGHAAVIYVSPFAPTISAQTQARYGARWGNAATAYTASSSALLSGANITNNGKITVAALDLGATETTVVTVDGNVTTNTWNPATYLSSPSGDPSGVVAVASFGGNTNGAAAVEWGDGDGTMRAAARPSIAVPWGATQTINGPVPCGNLGPTCSGPLAASVNTRGHAVVIFATSNADFTSFDIWASSE